MIRMLGRYIRALRLGLALERLEAAERSGASVCIHSSWCATPGDGFWIALVRPVGWRGAPLGKPVVGSDLIQVLSRAGDLIPPAQEENVRNSKREAPVPRGDLVPESHVIEQEWEEFTAANPPVERLARSLRRPRTPDLELASVCEVCGEHVEFVGLDGTCEACFHMIKQTHDEAEARRNREAARRKREARPA